MYTWHPVTKNKNASNAPCILRNRTFSVYMLKHSSSPFLFSLQTQLTRIQTEVTSGKSSSEKSLQLKISELLTMLEQRQTTITRQEEVCNITNTQTILRMFMGGIKKKKQGSFFFMSGWYENKIRCLCCVVHQKKHQPYIYVLLIWQKPLSKARFFFDVDGTMQKCELGVNLPAALKQ